ncbi:hypothetical protein FACS1894198_4320 [Clostridia bacterium]|nr:hypothetical protein FACS1894198_4320 [Clostridia bacterium]
MKPPKSIFWCSGNFILTRIVGFPANEFEDIEGRGENEGEDLDENGNEDNEDERENVRECSDVFWGKVGCNCSNKGWGKVEREHEGDKDTGEEESLGRDNDSEGSGEDEHDSVGGENGGLASEKETECLGEDDGITFANLS